MLVSRTYRALCCVLNRPVNRVARAAVHMHALVYDRMNSTPCLRKRVRPGRLAASYPGGTLSRGVSWSDRKSTMFLPFHAPNAGECLTLTSSRASAMACFLPTSFLLRMTCFAPCFASCRATDALWIFEAAPVLMAWTLACRSDAFQPSRASAMLSNAKSRPRPGEACKGCVCV